MSVDALWLSPGSRCAVRNYAARNTWIDLCDLEQEAAVAALEARASWRADGGASIESWESWIVGLALSRFVAEARVPVSLPKRKGENWREASSAHGVDVDALDDFAQFEDVEELLDRRRAAAEVRRILDEESEAAKAVLLGEQKSAEVAERLHTSVREVYSQTAEAMRALRAAFANPIKRWMGGAQAPAELHEADEIHLPAPKATPPIAQPVVAPVVATPIAEPKPSLVRRVATWVLGVLGRFLRCETLVEDKPGPTHAARGEYAQPFGGYQRGKFARHSGFRVCSAGSSVESFFHNPVGSTHARGSPRLLRRSESRHGCGLLSARGAGAWSAPGVLDPGTARFESSALHVSHGAAAWGERIRTIAHRGDLGTDRCFFMAMGCL